MELLVLSDYGSKEELKLENPSESDIIETMSSIDWNSFHQVCLSKNDSDWLEVGGNLKEDGLSVIYEINNEQFVIDHTPTSIHQLTEILLSFYKADGLFKTKYQFTGETNNINSSVNIDDVYKQPIKEDRTKNNENNPLKGYTIMEMAELFLFAPYYFVKGSRRFLSFLELTNENYTLKLLQKVIIYALSFITWYQVLMYFIHK